MDPTQEQDSTYLDRLAAMSLLRENMFLSNPSTYAMTDIAEDLPGSLRGIGGALKNVLPSKAIISEDPVERKRQIQEAVDKIKASRGSTEGLSDEVLHNILSTAKSSVIPGAAMAALFHALHLRGVKPGGIMAGYLKGVAPYSGVPSAKGLASRSLAGWQLPFAPLKTIKKLFTRPGQAAKFLGNTLKDTALNTTMAAATGAAVPIIAKMTGVSDAALQDAQKIMEEQPYITSLPSSEMLSVIKEQSDAMHDNAANRLKNIGLGAGLESVTQAAGAATPILLPAAGAALLNVVRGRRPGQGLSPQKMLKQIVRNAKGYAAFGAATGALGGAFTKNLIGDKLDELQAERMRQQLEKSDQPQNIDEPQSQSSYPV